MLFQTWSREALIFAFAFMEGDFLDEISKLGTCTDYPTNFKERGGPGTLPCVTFKKRPLNLILFSLDGIFDVLLF